MNQKQNLIVRLSNILISVKEQKIEESRVNNLSPFYKMLEKTLNRNGGNLKFITPENPSVKSQKEFEQKIDGQLKTNDDMRFRSIKNAGNNIVL